MSAMRTCPIPGCGAGLRSGHLMCLRHWRMVPQPKQREVNRTWRYLRKVGTRKSIVEYEASVKAAIDAIAAEVERSLP